MDCGVFLKAPQGLVGSPCNALILLPHSLPTSPTHPPTTRSPAMAPHTLHWDAADAKWTTIQQESVASLAADIPSRFPILYLTSVSSLLPHCQHLCFQLVSQTIFYIL